MALFDKTASTYDSWCETELGALVDDIEKNIINKLAAIKEQDKVLDLGCGTGIYSLFMAKKALDVTGVDISEEMLAIAKEKVESEKLNIEFVKADIHQLPFSDNTFDLVVSNITLEFVEDPKQVLKEVFRVLKNNGRFVCGFINKESSWGQKYVKQGEANHDSVFANATFFTPETVKTLTENQYEKIEYGLYFSPEEFVNRQQALAIEANRATNKNTHAGYYAVRWIKAGE